MKRRSLNSETILALAERQEMENNPDKYKRYKSFDEAIDEVFTDV